MHFEWIFKKINEIDEIADQKLMQTCWWLILSGFPQYVQMYKGTSLKYKCLLRLQVVQLRVPLE